MAGIDDVDVGNLPLNPGAINRDENRYPRSTAPPERMKLVGGDRVAFDAGLSCGKPWLRR
jgi:hypothetical protein